MRRILFLAAFAFMGWHGMAWAQVGCVPNPNLNGQPFVDGCPIPASGLNKIPTPPVSLVDNLTGTITPASEGAVLAAISKPGISAEQIANWVYCNCSNTPFDFDALRGVAYDNGGQTIPLVNAVAGYVVNNSVKATGPVNPTGVALLGVGVAASDEANIWGVNTALSDNMGQQVSSGTARILYGAEFDLNVTSPSTNVFGAITQGASLSQPTVSNGYTCGPLSFSNSGIIWSGCFQSDDYVTPTAMIIGLEGSAGNSGKYPPTPVASEGSQLILMNYNDVSAVEHQLVMQASLEAGNGGGGASLAINSNSGSLSMGLGLIKGGFWTGNTTLVTNGLTLGAQAASGTSINSQDAVLAYFDNTGTAQNVSIFAKGGSTPIVEFNSTAGTTALSMGTSVGVSCTVNTPAHITVVGGIVTLCN